MHMHSYLSFIQQVAGFGPENDGLKNALEGSEIVVIPAGVPRKPVSCY